MCSFPLPSSIYVYLSAHAITLTFSGAQSGASSKSLLTSSYNTTVVDVNPFLVPTVQAYFNVPAPDAVVSQDPTIWVQRYAKQLVVGREGKERFDSVVHDVFDGGELPARMYTMEFWNATATVLDENGVLAVVSSVLHCFTFLFTDRCLVGFRDTLGSLQL